MKSSKYTKAIPQSLVVLSLGLVSNYASADQVILDDLIVDGSACIGLDCVNGESFGFDTLRLKENNLRIKAQDTSSTASFPSNDWQITFNDSSNGGQNKFSIDDIDHGRTPFTIEANAPSHSLYVDDGGRLGLGTSTPVVEAHIKDGDTPTVRLEQDGTSGFTAQTWDMAGNETNFFIRDVTHGSKLPFRIRPDAPTSAIDVQANGHVGIGTSSVSSGNSADQVLEVKRVNGSASLTLDYGGTNKFGEFLLEEDNTAKWSIGASSNQDYFYIYQYNGVNRYRLSLDSTNGNLGLGGVTTATSPIQHSNGAILTAGGVWQDASSKVLKQDINPLSDQEARKALAELQPVRFKYIADPNDEVVGFIAEEVPDLVATASRKTISSMDIVAVLTKVVQGQEAAIRKLKKEITLLQQHSQ